MPGSSNDLHVLHVVRTLGAGGGMERNLYRIVVALTARGIKSSILLLSDNTDVIDFGDFAKVFRIVAAEKDRRILLEIRDLITSVRPDIIHARNWATWPDTAMSRVACFPRPPLIFSFHGFESAAAPLKRRLAARAMARLTTRIFTVSHAGRTFLKEQYDLGDTPIEVIHNGVDVDNFEPPPWREPSGRLIVGGMGRLYSKVKNFPLLLKAAARLVHDGVDLEVRIAGGGTDIISHDALVEELQITDRVRFLGHIENIPKFLSELDVFVLSSDSEGMPNSLLEAMAMGRACVSTEVGGVGEILEGASAGLMVPARDVPRMAEALGLLLRDHGLRRRLGEAARRHVVDNFSTDRMFDRYEQYYRETARLRRADF